MKPVHNTRHERPDGYRYIMERPVDTLGLYVYGVEIKAEWPRGRQAMELRRARYILQRRVEELRRSVEVSFGLITRAVHSSKPVGYKPLEDR